MVLRQLITRYANLKSRGKVTLSKSPENLITLAITTYDSETGDQVESRSISFRRSNIVDLRQGMRDELDGINAMLADIDLL